MTGTLKAKVNGQWVPVGGGSTPTQQWNSAWGIVARAIAGTAPDQTVSAAEVELCGTQLRSTVNLVGGRYTRFKLNVVMTPSTVPTAVYVRVKINNNVAYLWSVVLAAAQSPETIELFSPPGAYSGNVSITWTVQVAYGGNVSVPFSTWQNATAVVEDVGPVAGATAIPNPYMPIYKTQAVQQTITPAQGLVNVIALGIPNLQVGQQALIHFNAAVSQPTAGSFDLVFVYNNMGPNNQQFSNAAGTILNFSTMVVGTGATVSCFVQINAWGGQSVVLSSLSSIIAVVYPV